MFFSSPYVYGVTINNIYYLPLPPCYRCGGPVSSMTHIHSTDRSRGLLSVEEEVFSMKGNIITTLYNSSSSSSHEVMVIFNFFSSISVPVY